MLCNHISSLLGIECMPLSDSGDMAYIGSPFRFDDGDALPIYVQSYGERLRFFDDCGVVLHFIGRGMSFDDGRRCKFIKTAAEANGATFSDAGEVEVWASLNDAPSAFAKYISTLHSIVAWEKDQRDANVDQVLLIDEVALNLRAWKPSAELLYGREVRGVTQLTHKLDFLFDGTGIFAISCNGRTVSSTIKKVIDIRGSADNNSMPMLVVIDDRYDSDAAARESLVIQAVAPVMSFTALERNVHGTAGVAQGH